MLLAGVWVHRRRRESPDHAGSTLSAAVISLSSLRPQAPATAPGELLLCNRADRTASTRCNRMAQVRVQL